jgi:hypothetical protein
MRYAGVAPADRHLRLVVDNRRPKDFRMYISPEEIRRGPRKRFNWRRLAGNVAMIVVASLSMSVLVWAGVVWLTGW